MGCIYKLENLINHKIYIGQTKKFTRRKKEYKYKSINLTKRTKYKIMEEINKFGFDNFHMSIIEDNINDDELNEREIYWINKYDSRNPLIGYNSKEGGRGGLLIDESKQKMSESSKSFRHTEEEKLKRSIPIFVYSQNGLKPFVSAKLYADSINRDRSEITASIKRGIKINDTYVFYQDNNKREQTLQKIIDKKSKQNKVAKRSLIEYLLVYDECFNNKKSVETNM